MKIQVAPVGVVSRSRWRIGNAGTTGDLSSGPIINNSVLSVAQACKVPSTVSRSKERVRVMMTLPQTFWLRNFSMPSTAEMALELIS